MSEPGWKVLVPVEVLEGETVPEAVVDLLATCPVVVLGYHVLPEQTPPGQARLQFEERAQARLDDIATAFRDAGGDAETRLVFTHDEAQTLDRVADETGCAAILVPNPAPEIGRILVPLRGEADVGRVAAFVAALIGDRDVVTTFLHVAEDEEGTAAGRSVVDDAAARFREHGGSAGRVTTEVTVSGTPVREIAAAAADHDAVVMGEGEPSLRSFLLGDASERVAAGSLGPVVVVRRAPDDPAEP
ncbi:MAG: universal stress protein [Haloferacaceae archaeon]